MTGRRWRESEVNRDRRGRFAHKPRGSKAIEAVKATARRLMDMEDRRGPRLRWGEKGTRGWWYIPRGGATYWVRQESKPTMIRGHYYLPGRWYPVVPPREHWTSPNQYHGIAGQTPLTSVVPDDVRSAANADAYKRFPGEPSARSEEFRTRRRRGGEDEGLRRGLKRTTPTRKPRRKR